MRLCLLLASWLTNSPTHQLTRRSLCHDSIVICPVLFRMEDLPVEQITIPQRSHRIGASRFALVTRGWKGSVADCVTDFPHARQRRNGNRDHSAHTWTPRLGHTGTDHQTLQYLAGW